MTNGIFADRWFVKCSALLRLGYSRREVATAVAAGVILRVRKGWYTLPGTPLGAIEAFRIGGRLTGLSAFKSHGFWTPSTSKLHVTVPRDARSLRRPRDMCAPLADIDRQHCVITWNDERAARDAECPWRTSVVDSLVHILKYDGRVASIVCLDAALNSTLHGRPGIAERDLDVIFARSTLAAQSWRDELDGRSGSGGETEFRLLTKAAGIPFVPQPYVAGVGYLDGQIGPHTFVEIDGNEWHDNPIAREVDATRDAIVASRRGHVLRFTYKLYRGSWPVVLAAMLGALEGDWASNAPSEFPHFPWRPSPHGTSPKARAARAPLGRNGDDTASVV